MNNDNCSSQTDHYKGIVAQQTSKHPVSMASTDIGTHPGLAQHRAQMNWNIMDKPTYGLSHLIRLIVTYIMLCTRITFVQYIIILFHNIWWYIVKLPLLPFTTLLLFTTLYYHTDTIGLHNIILLYNHTIQHNDKPHTSTSCDPLLTNSWYSSQNVYPRDLWRWLAV